LRLGKRGRFLYLAPMIIAVDGPSAAGKGTVARAVAKELGYHFLDTGSLYRMVGLEMLRTQRDDEASAKAIASSLKPSSFNDLELRSESVAAMASKVAAMRAVRAALLQFQRDFAQQKPGAVLDGRDIGTVVCPDADLKFFVTASSQERARRRHAELKSLGQDVELDAVFDDIQARDERDATRSVAPTKPADDAILIDTSELDRDEVLKAVLEIVRDHA
jgi:CMP/dCMP kinase